MVAAPTLVRTRSAGVRLQQLAMRACAAPRLADGARPVAVWLRPFRARSAPFRVPFWRRGGDAIPAPAPAVVDAAAVTARGAIFAQVITNCTPEWCTGGSRQMQASHHHRTLQDTATHSSHNRICACWCWCLCWRWCCVAHGVCGNHSHPTCACNEERCTCCCHCCGHGGREQHCGCDKQRAQQHIQTAGHATLRALARSCSRVRSIHLHRIPVHSTDHTPILHGCR